MMTEEELAAMERRAEKATEGPWWVEHPADGRDAYIAFGTQGYRADTYDLMEHYEVDRDYEFIAAARQDIPALVAECRRLREALTRVLDESWFVLSGGDDPHDRCTECGCAGYGMLRDALHDAHKLLGIPVPGPRR